MCNIFLNHFLASILHLWNVPKRLRWRHLLQSTLAKETHTLGSQTYLYIISWCAMLAKLASGLSRNWSFEVCYIAIGSLTQSLGPKASLRDFKTTCNLATWNCPPTQSSPSSLAGLPACRRSFPVKSLSHPTPSKDIRLSLPTFKDATLRFTSRSLKCKIMRNLWKFTSFFQNGSQWRFGESPDLPTIPPTLRNYIKTSAAMWLATPCAKISALALHVAREVSQILERLKSKSGVQIEIKIKGATRARLPKLGVTCQQTALRASQTHRARTSEAPNPKTWPLCTSESLRSHWWHVLCSPVTFAKPWPSSLWTALHDCFPLILWNKHPLCHTVSFPRTTFSKHGYEETWGATFYNIFWKPYY